MMLTIEVMVMLIILILVIILQCTHIKSSHHRFQFSSVAQSCPTLSDPMNRSMPGLSVEHQLLQFTQTHVH